MLVVMKFGGTSVADAKAIIRVINHIKTRRTKKTIVVVSAISEATNILTKLAALAAENKLKSCKKILAQFKKRHLKIADDLLHNEKLLAQTINQINSYFTEIEAALAGISLISELSDRSFAKVVAYGELLSSTILHAAMLEHGIKNILIDAHNIIVTNDNYLKGNPNLEHMAKTVPPLLNKHLNQNTIVLTQGFIAGTMEGVTTILGREGSDYSATLIGMIMDADEVQIWTDVDGIMTSDPKKIANTRFIPQLSFQEATELSYFGAKVIHPLTIKPAARKNIPVRILNSTKLEPKQKGTLITNDTKTKQTKISSITYRESIKILNISLRQISPQHDFITTVFSLLNAEQVAIDAATISSSNISLILNYKEQLDKVVSKLAPFAKTTIEENLSLICIVGKNFNNIEKIAKNIFRILAGYNVRMIVHGPSNTSLILLVPKSYLATIVQKLHDAFFYKKTNCLKTK